MSERGEQEQPMGIHTVVDSLRPSWARADVKTINAGSPTTAISNLDELFA